MQRLRDLVAGKCVALVGNAESIYRSCDGEVIDDHDIVIRINCGLPHLIGRPADIGTRTDVWVAAKYWRHWTPDMQLISFTKMTKLGDRDWDRYQRAAPGIPMERWTFVDAAACAIECECDPGSGLRTLWALKRLCHPLAINLFGFDCWKTVSTWSGKRNTPNHSPEKELAAIEKLCRPSKTSTIATSPTNDAPSADT